MKQFTTLLEAAELAVTLATGWRFATSDERYDAKGLLVLAEMGDSENPIDEDSFYVVSPAGAIGLCADGEDIDWLFVFSIILFPYSVYLDPRFTSCLYDYSYL